MLPSRWKPPLDAIAGLVAAVSTGPLQFNVASGSRPDLPVRLPREFGPDIYVENLQADRVVALESMRRGPHRAGLHLLLGAGKA